MDDLKKRYDYDLAGNLLDGSVAAEHNQVTRSGQLHPASQVRLRSNRKSDLLLPCQGQLATTEIDYVGQYYRQFQFQY